MVSDFTKANKINESRITFIAVRRCFLLSYFDESAGPVIIISSCRTVCIHNHLIYYMCTTAVKERFNFWLFM